MPDIPVWNKCDNRCVMCTNGAEFASQPSSLYGLKAQVGKFERYLKGRGRVYLKNSDKTGFISLTGGEPALHPELFKLLAYFRKRLPSTPVTLLTNGRRFADGKFTRRFAAAAKPPFTVAVPLHAASARLHDRIAGVAGAFRETMEGLGNLFSSGTAAIEIRVVMHRLNIENVAALTALLARKFRPWKNWRVCFIHYEIEGMSEVNHERLALKLSDSARVLNSLAGRFASLPEVRLYHFPLCLVRRELRPACMVTIPREDRVYTRKCAGCALRKDCLGLMLEYYRKFGDAELKPRRAAVHRRRAAARGRES